jgi:cytochrome d ubiquinol oxidase subunit I
VPPDQRPPIVPVFFAFRIMVGIGFLMIATGLYGAFLWWRGRLVTTRWYLQIVQYFWPLGFIAVLCGWITTEVGRQPWVAYGILRTADAISPVAAGTVFVTLVLFILVYGVIFGMGLYYINRLIVRGPQGRALEGSTLHTPARPLAAAHDAAREAMHPGG